MITGGEDAIGDAFFFDIHMVGIKVDEDVVGPDPFDHLHRLPARVDQMRFVAVHRFNAEFHTQPFCVGGGGSKRAGDVIQLGLRGRQAGPLPYAAIGDAGQRQTAHGGGFIQRDFQKVDRPFWVVRRPCRLRQTKRADCRHSFTRKQRAGVGGVNRWRRQQGDFHEIEVVAHRFGHCKFCRLGRPVHGPDAGMDAEAFHGVPLRLF